MLDLFFILLAILGGLTAFLWIGTFFFQGYIYTEPTPRLYWQAPATAAIMTFGFAIWIFATALASGVSPGNIPVDTIMRFSPNEDMRELGGRPAGKVWAVKQRPRKTADKIVYEEDATHVAYRSVRDDQKRFHYEVDLPLAHLPWQSQDVIAILIKIPVKDGEPKTIRFDLIPTETSGYRRFASQEGWVMDEFPNGPTGLPTRFRASRLFLNLIFNFGHLFVWFVTLWLILRFQWAHALGFGAVLWAACTLVLLPMVLTYAAHIAEIRHAMSR